MTRKFLFPLLLIVIAVLVVNCKEDTYADWKVLNEKAYADSLSLTSYSKTESGLCYRIIDPGQMKRPNVDSKVKVQYVGRLVTGEVFDEGVYKGYLSSTVAGWQEALTMIKVGGSMEICFPYSLGYGTSTSGVIPPYSMLSFSVVLLDAEY